ncbi:unnamed protein product [Trichobilharzia regenti]|nr:unnamed protein product [Trichobilharzia regenti]
MFDTTCQSFAFLGHGYVLRGSVGDAPKGIGSIPPIFTAPLLWLQVRRHLLHHGRIFSITLAVPQVADRLGDKGSCLSPVDVYTIVMQINSTLHHGSDDENDNLNELLKQPRYVYDEKLSHTYYIKKIERRVYLALVYEGLKSPKDKSINEFISMLTETVCLHQVVNLLRQRQQTSASSSSSERNYLRSLFFH